MKRAISIGVDLVAALLCGSVFVTAAWFAAGFWAEALK